MINRAIADQANNIAVCNVGLIESMTVQCASIVMVLPTRLTVGFGHVAVCEATLNVRRLGSMDRIGARIICAVGVDSRVGAGVTGSTPRFVIGLAAAGFIVPTLATVAAVAVVVGAVAVGLDGSAQGTVAVAVTGLGAVKSPIRGAMAGFALYQS